MQSQSARERTLGDGPVTGGVTRRQLLHSAALAGAGSALSACGIGSQTDTRVAPPAPAELAGSISFLMWVASGPLYDSFQELIGRFQKTNPKAKVEYVGSASGDPYFAKLETMLAGGTPPDVFFQSSYTFRRYIDRGIVVPLDPYIRRDKVDVDDYISAGMTSYRHKDSTWGLPRGIGGNFLFYNTELFDRAGIKYPPADWTQPPGRWTTLSTLPAVSAGAKARHPSGDSGPAIRITTGSGMCLARADSTSTRTTPSACSISPPPFAPSSSWLI